ncbi:alpha-2-macroglobulin-like [Leptodactylus fuscus]|uniref:alpha-2-macroglobulin-like n=1 Tax=Leptodactylus fuscus TaxID=238119 RepID=UPI003F4E5E66
MGCWSLCIGLVMLQIFGTLEAKLHYAAIFPSDLHAQNTENICLQLTGAEGESKVKVSLNMENKDITLIEKNFQQDDLFTCLSVQAPLPEDYVQRGTLTLTIESSGESLTNTKEVFITKKSSDILVQTDKAIYKPGQTVKFRILSLYEDFKPENTMIPVVEVKDPDSNRISQWLNVSLVQGIAELSFALSSEPTLGLYSINVNGILRYFDVEEYVLPKFEVTIHFPKYVLFNSKQFPVKVCGKYTYGKPVRGNFTVTICRPLQYYYGYWLDTTIEPLCANFSEKLDRSGCHTIQVKDGLFTIRKFSMKNRLKGTVSIKEEGTGVELTSSGQTEITNDITKVSFINAVRYYKSGRPYNGSIRVEDAGGLPKPNITVYMKSSSDWWFETLVTDESGQASFTLDTTYWTGTMQLMAKTSSSIQPYSNDKFQPDYVEAFQDVYSQRKRFLKLNSLDHALPCEGHQEVHVEYNINHAKIKDAKKLSLNYLLISKDSIKNSGTVEIKIENMNQDINGEVTLNLTLSKGTSKICYVLVYILLPNGEILTESERYDVLPCFKDKVSFEFSPHEVLPGSDVSLQVGAAPGSLCGLRVVDKSVVLMEPELELTVDRVFETFNTFDGWYDRVFREKSCEYEMYESNMGDEHILFKALSLKISTSAKIRKPLMCRREQKHASPVIHYEDSDQNTEFGAQNTERLRTYFPETWIWELVTVDESGKTEIHHKAPDTITDWSAGAICMGPSGFGMSPTSSLRVFQPFFVDLTLPYSVVRGETFTLKASVFNYLKHCIKVQTTLKTTNELEEQKCDSCQYNRCICADESKIFYWNLKATKLGEVNITVRTEAVDTKEFCGKEIPLVPKQGKADTIVKTVLVQPGGVLEEKSHSSLICIKEEGQSKVEEISLKIPDNILEDSARAYITVLGDLMGTALQNLDHLLAMPYGCGEQNMVLFAPNIFILQYLEKTHQLTDEILNKAKKFLESGYQRQLTYKHHDGSYSAFGKRDTVGKTWLTGFVVKSFSKARPYIFIDESHLNHSFSWLKNNQQDTGCFRSVGRLFNNAMKGGVEDDISLSAYITIALLDARLSLKDPLLSNALSCLRNASEDVSNVYTQALLAYTFTLCGETELRKTLLDKLDQKSVRGGGQLHWKRDSTPRYQDSYWHRAPSAEVEMTSYVLLALLSGPSPDIDKASQIVNWLTKQQNPYGGYSSTQDTVVALQALAKYAEVTYSDKGDFTVAVSSKSGFLEKFYVDKNNRLLLQRALLSKNSENYFVTATGGGCVFVQVVLRYNVPPPKSEATFSFSVKSSSERECLEDSVTAFRIVINATYIGTREKSNMAIIEIKMLSGYIPVKSTVNQLEKDKLIQRSEIQMDMVTLYLNEIGRDPVTLAFVVEQDMVVKDLKPATAKVYDYYETDEYSTVEYNLPCSNDKSGNTR